MEHKINNKLIRAIKTKQRALGMTDETYRTILSDRYWVNTCKELSLKDAHDFLDHLDTLGRQRRVQGYKATGGFKRNAPGKQYESSMKGFREEICALAQQRFGEGWEKPLNALCKTVVQVDHYKFLHYATAKTIKDALVNLEARGPYRRKYNPPVPAPSSPKGDEEAQAYHDEAVNI